MTERRIKISQSQLVNIVEQVIKKQDTEERIPVGNGFIQIIKDVPVKNQSLTPNKGYTVLKVMKDDKVVGGDINHRNGHSLNPFSSQKLINSLKKLDNVTTAQLDTLITKIDAKNIDSGALISNLKNEGPKN